RACVVALSLAPYIYIAAENDSSGYRGRGEEAAIASIAQRIAVRVIEGVMVISAQIDLTLDGYVAEVGQQVNVGCTSVVEPLSVYRTGYANAAAGKDIYIPAGIISAGAPVRHAADGNAAGAGIEQHQTADSLLES